jgi:hypothetical protein
VSGLPAILEAGQVVEPGTGELVALRDASDRALVVAAEQITALDAEVFARKRGLAAELRDRHGVGTVNTAGYRFTIAESQSWSKGATAQALERLLAAGAITEADANRAMPARPTPDPRALKALAGRLTVSDPDAARVLASACTISPPSLRGIEPTAVDEERDRSPAQP